MKPNTEVIRTPHCRLPMGRCGHVFFFRDHVFSGKLSAHAPGAGAQGQGRRGAGETLPLPTAPSPRSFGRGVGVKTEGR